MTRSVDDLAADVREGFRPMQWEADAALAELVALVGTLESEIDEMDRRRADEWSRAEAAETSLADMRRALKRAKMRAVDAYCECGIAAPQDHFLRDIETICDRALAAAGPAPEETT